MSRKARHRLNVPVTLLRPAPARKTVGKRLLTWIGAFGALVGAVIGAVTVYDRFFRSPNVIVEDLMPYSAPFDSHLAENPPHLHFEPALSITNLEAKTIAVVDVKPFFRAFAYQGHNWQLIPERVLFGLSYDSEAKLTEKVHRDHERAKLNQGHDQQPYIWRWEEPEGSSPPFTIKSGETRYFIFSLMLYVYRDGEQCRGCRLTAENGYPEKDNGFADMLIARYEAGQAPAIKAVPFTIVLDDGRKLKRDLDIFNVVVGDMLWMPTEIEGYKARPEFLKKAVPVPGPTDAPSGPQPGDPK